MYSDYEDTLKELYPDINQDDIDLQVNKYFATWFENHVRVKLVLLSLFSFAKCSYILLFCPIYRHMKKKRTSTYMTFQEDH